MDFRKNKSLWGLLQLKTFIFVFAIAAFLGANQASAFTNNSCAVVFGKKHRDPLKDFPKDTQDPQTGGAVKFPINTAKIVDLAQKSELKVLTYNLENLLLDGQGGGKNSGKRSRDPKAIPVKPEWKARWAAETIRRLDPDVLMLEELISDASTREFLSRYLDDAYEFHSSGVHDERGLSVGFLVKKNLAEHFDFKVESNVSETWNDPVAGGKQQTLFNRDLPVLMMTRKGKGPRGPPSMIFVAAHLKSKRDRPGDTESAKWRGEQIKRTGEILARLYAQYGKDALIVFGGDTNGDLNSNEFDSLFGNTSFRNSLDFAAKPVTGEDRATHAYFPPGNGTPQYDQLDGLLIPQEQKGLVKDSRVIRYINNNGNEVPLPKSFDERKSRQPSDHYPLLAIFDFQKLLNL